MSDSGSSKTYKLFILAGQSNMEGHGFVSDLSAELKRVQDAVPIYHPNRLGDGQQPENVGRWMPLQPGHGKDFRFEKSSRGWEAVPGDRFGPELTFATRLRELRPGERIALFKYAKGGSSIQPETTDDWGTWFPDAERLNQWSHFQHHYRRALKEWKPSPDRNKKILNPAGIVWMQGESDAAYFREIAESYRANLGRLITKMRELTGVRTLPVVIGQISDTGMEGNRPALPHAKIVQQAQREFVANDPHTALISPPANHGWLDPWHYDSQTYLELGRHCAGAMNNFLKKD